MHLTCTCSCVHTWACTLAPTHMCADMCVDAWTHACAHSHTYWAPLSMWVCARTCTSIPIILLCAYFHGESEIMPTSWHLTLNMKIAHSRIIGTYLGGNPPNPHHFSMPGDEMRVWHSSSCTIFTLVDSIIGQIWMINHLWCTIAPNWFSSYRARTQEWTLSYLAAPAYESLSSTSMCNTHLPCHQDDACIYHPQLTHSTCRRDDVCLHIGVMCWWRLDIELEYNLSTYTYKSPLGPKRVQDPYLR